MHPRLATTAALCRETALPALILVCLAASGPAGLSNTGAASTVTRDAPSLAAFGIQAPPIALSAADAGIVSQPTPEETSAAPASLEADPIVTAALTNSPEMLPVVTRSNQADESTMASLEPGDADHSADSPGVLDRCSTEDACIDRYLWGLYQRTPKEDAIRVQEQRKVSIKRKGRMVTVTRSFTTVTDEDFSWKDPKAADKAGLPATDYVIGGIDRDFRQKLFQMLRAADMAGLSPGITSGFRDDYRQSIASGLKAANDRSYHGGSFRGGYGHGLAADIVSVNGATRAQRLAASDVLWKWVDNHGKEFGIGRPYLDRDPPHVAPIDGKEYADHHPGMKARQERSTAKHHSVIASREHRSSAKRSRTAS